MLNQDMRAVKFKAWKVAARDYQHKSARDISLSYENRPFKGDF
jgi:hypothetical protein